MPRNKTSRVLSQKEVLERGLPLKHLDERYDGYIFRHYYLWVDKETGKETDKVYEQWLSPSSWEKQAKTKAKQKKLNSSLNRSFVRRVKSIYGCSVCGYKKSLMALHFHHTGPKRGEISTMLGYSRKSLKEEIRNCILVCSNCHCEIHENEEK
tara:strand:- start:1222 stop:1680 length:459 start_codon:yes stop_codon:yes gene_type:complete